MTTLTATDHATAALARIAPLAPPWVTVKTPGEIVLANPKPANYIELYAERRYAEDPMVSPGTDARYWRISAHWVTATEGNGHTLETLVYDALEHYALTVGGVLTTPLMHETSEATAQDRDRSWSGFVDLTYRA